MGSVDDYFLWHVSDGLFVVTYDRRCDNSLPIPGTGEIRST